MWTEWIFHYLVVQDYETRLMSLMPSHNACNRTIYMLCYGLFRIGDKVFKYIWEMARHGNKPFFHETYFIYPFTVTRITSRFVKKAFEEVKTVTYIWMWCLKNELNKCEASSQHPFTYRLNYVICAPLISFSVVCQEVD